MYASFEIYLLSRIGSPRFTVETKLYKAPEYIPKGILGGYAPSAGVA